MFRRLLFFLLFLPLAAQVPVSTTEAWRAAKTEGAVVEPLEGGAARLKFSPAERASVSWETPADARDFTKAGALTFEFESSSTIWFRVALVNAAGQRFDYRINPWARVPARAAIAGRYLTSEYLNNQSHQGYMISNWANHIDLRDVRAVEVFMAPTRR